MSPERFDHLLSLVKPYISIGQCFSRIPIQAEERLAITLRYLASGDSQQSQAFNFRVGRSTVSKIVRQVCQALWDALSSIYLKTPSSQVEWEKIAQEFMEEWQFPHVIGCLDGKHCMIECPKHGGSTYYNYKGFHSVNLMATCDAKYRFVHVDIGSYGKDNDAAIFQQTELYQQLSNGSALVPPPDILTETGYRLPYVLLGDDIFPLKPWLMKPFPGKNLSEEQRVYNYRLSRCRRTIENAFGILSARWRIFRRPIKADTDLVDLIVQACVCLHNYLLSTCNSKYCPTGFVDCEDASGELREGDWRGIVRNDCQPALAPIVQQGSNNYTIDAKTVRNEYMHYVNSEGGSLEWQLAYVRNTGRTQKN